MDDLVCHLAWHSDIRSVVSFLSSMLSVRSCVSLSYNVLSGVLNLFLLFLCQNSFAVPRSCFFAGDFLQDPTFLIINFQAPSSSPRNDSFPFPDGGDQNAPPRSSCLHKDVFFFSSYLHARVSHSCVSEAALFNAKSFLMILEDLRPRLSFFVSEPPNIRIGLPPPLSLRSPCLFPCGGELIILALRRKEGEQVSKWMSPHSKWLPFPSPRDHPTLPIRGAFPRDRKCFYGLPSLVYPPSMRTLLLSSF